MGDTVISYCRWAVPFFFITSGYFFYLNYSKNGFPAFRKTLLNLGLIFLTVNFVYLIFHLFNGSLRTVLSLYTQLAWGLYFHLWFINSLIGTYVLFWFILKLRLEYLLIPISVVLLAYFLCTNPYNFIFHIKFKLFALNAISFPFVTIGYYLSVVQSSKRSVSQYTGIILLIAGVAIQQFEITKLAIHSDLYIGTVFYAIGIFIIALNAKTSSFSTMADYGRKYSLVIYLYHPLINFYLLKLIKTYVDKIIPINSVAVIAIEVAVNLMLFIFIDKFSTPLFKALNGSFNFTSHQQNKLTTTQVDVSAVLKK